MRLQRKKLHITHAVIRRQVTPECKFHSNSRFFSNEKLLPLLLKKFLEYRCLPTHDLACGPPQPFESTLHPYILIS
jgi:hypothetical protein